MYITNSATGAAPALASQVLNAPDEVKYAATYKTYADLNSRAICITMALHVHNARKGG